MRRFAFFVQVTLLAIFAQRVQAVAASPDETHFDIWEIQVEGAALIDDERIERIVYPHLGPGKSFADVEAARDDLESAFRAAGFGTVAVTIPEQDVAEGVVRLAVIQGSVERLTVSGSRYFSLGRIRSRVPGLSPGRVPNLPEVQQQLADLNRASPDRSVTPVLQPGRRPGGVEVELKVKDELPVHGSVELNDQYSRDTSRTRLNVAMRYDNLWQREHSIGIAYQLSPEDPSEVKVLSGTYMFHPTASDALLALYAVKSDSDVLTLSSGSGGVGVLGKGVITGARWINPLPGSRSVFHNLTLGLDYKDFEDTVSPAGTDGFKTPISYAKFVAGYGGALNFDRTRVGYNLEANFGVRAFGNTEKEFESKRFQAKPNFLYLRASSSIERTWLADSRILLALSAQLASDPIISNEQFSLGGADTVRGYVETQLLADDAIVGSLTLRSPSLHRYTRQEWLSNLRLFVFGDVAQARILEPLPDQAENVTLGSVGLGLEFASPLGFESRVVWARPLIRNGDIRPGESRFHVSFMHGF